MAVREKGDVFESYERALSGPKMDEQEWDRKVIPETAKKLKEKYGLKFDKGKINPTDDDVLDIGAYEGVVSSSIVGITGNVTIN